jgi:general secretion pathway protein G
MEAREAMKATSYNRTQKRGPCVGFTLLEILIVITILGILASIVAVKIMDRPGEARVMKARMDIQTLESALKLFKIDNAFYPSTDQGLRALVEQPTIGRVPNRWREGGYLEKRNLPKDPWGNEYLYFSPGIHNPDFDIWSYGADGLEGGQGEDADINNWEEPS